jgi:hypothetical protein
MPAGLLGSGALWSRQRDEQQPTSRFLRPPLLLMSCLQAD